MKRKHLRRADYATGVRVTRHRPRGGAFNYRHHADAASRSRKRETLMILAMAEFRHGGDSIASLYASLLVGRLLALEPRAAEELGIPIEG